MTHGNRKWFTLAVGCLALFMAILDNLVVNIALPTISRDLRASTTQLQWIVSAYTLVFASIQITAGGLGDRLGRKRWFLIGLALFTGASLAGAASRDVTMLITARALQGIGAAFIMPLTLSLISVAFPPDERPRAIGIWSAISVSGLAFGPIVGGALVEYATWQWVFLINVPLGVLTFILSLWFVRESRDESGDVALDIPGTLLITGAIASLTWGLIEAGERGWGDTFILAAFALATVLFAAFIAVEARVARPMVPLGFFRNRTFTGANLDSFAISFAIGGVAFFLTLYQQNIHGFSPVRAGLTLLPMVLVMMVGAPFSGMLAARIGTRLLISIGMVISGVGLLLFLQSGVSASYFDILPAFLVLGLGNSLIFAPMTTAILNSVDVRRSGVASAVTGAVREIGTAFSIALLGTIANRVYRAEYDAAPGIAAARESLDLPPPAQEVIGVIGSGASLAGRVIEDPQRFPDLPVPLVAIIRDASGAAFVSGMHTAIIVSGAGILAMSVISYLLIRDAPQPTTATDARTAPDPDALPAPSPSPEFALASASVSASPAFATTDAFAPAGSDIVAFAAPPGTYLSNGFGDAPLPQSVADEHGGGEGAAHAAFPLPPGWEPVENAPYVPAWPEAAANGYGQRFEYANGESGANGTNGTNGESDAHSGWATYSRASSNAFAEPPTVAPVEDAPDDDARYVSAGWTTGAADATPAYGGGYEYAPHPFDAGQQQEVIAPAGGVTWYDEAGYLPNGSDGYAADDSTGRGANVVPPTAHLYTPQVDGYAAQSQGDETQPHLYAPETNGYVPQPQGDETQVPLYAVQANGHEPGGEYAVEAPPVYAAYPESQQGMYEPVAYAPSPDPEQHYVPAPVWYPQQQPAPFAASVATWQPESLETRIAALEQQGRTPPPSDATEVLAERLGALEQYVQGWSVEALSERLGMLEQYIQGWSHEREGDAAVLDAMVHKAAALEEMIARVESDVPVRLSGEIGALERRVAQLVEELPAQLRTVTGAHTEATERLASRLTVVEQLGTRVAALERLREEIAGLERLEAAATGLEWIEPRVDDLERYAQSLPPASWHREQDSRNEAFERRVVELERFCSTLARRGTSSRGVAATIRPDAAPAEVTPRAERR